MKLFLARSLIFVVEWEEKKPFFNKNINTFLFHLYFAYKIKKTFIVYYLGCKEEEEEEEIKYSKEKIEIIFLLPI